MSFQKEKQNSIPKKGKQHKNKILEKTKVRRGSIQPYSTNTVLLPRFFYCPQDPLHWPLLPLNTLVQLQKLSSIIQQIPSIHPLNPLGPIWGSQGCCSLPSYWRGGGRGYTKLYSHPHLNGQFRISKCMKHVFGLWEETLYMYSESIQLHMQKQNATGNWTRAFTQGGKSAFHYTTLYPCSINSYSLPNVCV